MDQDKLKDICDATILRHGFARYNRDYEFLIEIRSGEISGQYILRFKHVYELKFVTMLAGETLKLSTDDSFTDYNKWKGEGEKEGFVWGVNYSLAYPGFCVINNSDKADKWTETLGFNMFEVTLETEVFKIDFVTHDFELVKLAGNEELVNIA